MLAGFILGLSLGIFIAGFVYLFMDAKIYKLHHKHRIIWKDIK